MSTHSSEWVWFPVNTSFFDTLVSKTVAQIEENITAMDFGPLSGEQMKEIDELLGS